jgi:hypothetical protein
MGSLYPARPVWSRLITVDLATEIAHQIDQLK